MTENNAMNPLACYNAMVRLIHIRNLSGSVGPITVAEYKSAFGSLTQTRDGTPGVKRPAEERSPTSRSDRGAGRVAGRSYRNKLDSVTSFIMTVSQIEADTTLSAHAKGIAVLRQLDQTLVMLELQGQRTKEIEEHLRAVTCVALDGLAGMSKEVGMNLTALARHHQPPITFSEFVRHYWERKILRWRRGHGYTKE